MRLSAISPNRLNILLTLLDQFEQERLLTKHRHIMTSEAKQAKANEIIKNHVGFALGAALVPFPGADLLAVSGVQLNMLRQLAKLYNLGFMDALGKNIISAVAGGSVARLGASLVKAIPGVGTIIGELSMPALSGASTYALGKVVANHFAKGGSLEDFDLKSAKAKYKAEMEEAKQFAAEMETEVKTAPTAPDNSDTVMGKLTKLAEMREAGIITEEEFKQVKGRLLEQI